MSAIAPTNVDHLHIYRNATLVGSLRRTTSGAAFEYDAAFYEAHRALPGGLATHLPYSQRVIESHGGNLHPYFAGLLPEGLRLKALVQRAKTSEDDQFSLLVAAGPDCVGDLFPVLPGRGIEPLAASKEPTEPLDRLSFQELFARSLGDENEPTIAGVQHKLSPSVVSFPFAARGKRWILKLNPPDIPLLVENESFFLSAAKACGLRVPRVHLVRDRLGEPGLLVQRFDRRLERGRWRGIHQEDACQFLNRYPADKYRLKTSEIAAALSLCEAPLLARAQLLELVAFSYVIGNGDLHGKNVSIGGEDALQLTPAYDLLTTRPYKDLKLALQFEGRDDGVLGRDMLAFGARFGLSAKTVERKLARICDTVESFVPRVKEIGFDEQRTRQVEELMAKRISDLRAT